MLSLDLSPLFWCGLVGLADYFCGPYGSYASVSAAKAGLLARIPAPSSSVVENRNRLVFPDMIKSLPKLGTTQTSSKLGGKKKIQRQSDPKQGVLNLFALLQARYKTFEAKRQLALLFVSLYSISRCCVIINYYTASGIISYLSCCCLIFVSAFYFLVTITLLSP